MTTVTEIKPIPIPESQDLYFWITGKIGNLWVGCQYNTKEDAMRSAPTVMQGDRSKLFKITMTKEDFYE